MNIVESLSGKLDLLRNITGQKDLKLTDLQETEQLLNPIIISRERARVQGLEIINISEDADNLESALKKNELPPPSAFAVFTAGHFPPEGSVKIGELGNELFHNFPAPETEGHKGEVHMIPFGDGYYMLGFFGRAHPNEYFGERFGAILVAHQLRVIKEMIKRERTDLGIDPPVFMSYLTGAVEGHHLAPGEAGLILSDTEKTNGLHPGHGPTSVLAKHLGEHFQEKFNSTTDENIGKLFAQECEKINLPLQPVALAGTVSATEFENAEEIRDWKDNVEKTRFEATGDYAEAIFGNGYRDFVTAVFGMGVTFEPATLRQHFIGKELPFKKFLLAVITDTAGVKGSKNVSHKNNIEVALETSPKYQPPLFSALRRYVETPYFNIGKQPDFSIRTQLASY